MEFFFEKNFGAVLEQYQLPIRRNFEYLEKNGVFKFFKSLSVLLFLQVNQHFFSAVYTGKTAGDVSSWYGSFVYAKTPDLMRSAKLPRHPTVRYEKSDSKSDTLDKMLLIKGKKTGLELAYYHEN